MRLLDDIYQIDSRILVWCTHSPFQRQAVSLAKWVSKSGDGYLQILLPTLMLIADNNRGSHFFQVVVAAFALQLPIYWLLKNLLKRRRPPDIIPCFQSSITASDKFSFPSGHSSAAFLLANLSTLFYGIAVWPLYIWASLVALSRVILGVHFPTDILAGITLGTAIAFFSLWVFF